jgi:hypothetical protein
MSTINQSNGVHTTAASGVSDVLAQWEADRGLRSEWHAATYVSVPITTGRAFVEWFRREGRTLESSSEEYRTGHRANVMLPNIQKAGRFIELLRLRHSGVVIDPTTLMVEGWQQKDFHEFWLRVIERHVRRVIFLDGWHFSHGCSLEFEKATTMELDCVDERMTTLTSERGIELLGESIREINSLELDSSSLAPIRDRLLDTQRRQTHVLTRRLYKDQVLDHLAHTANVAQFVSFAPGRELCQRYSRIRGYAPNFDFGSPGAAVSSLLERAPEGCVNIRSYDPERPEGNPFLKRLSSVDTVLSALKALSDDRGLHTIVNESIDEHDGGVSGVAYRSVLEFAPDTTPRCVDDDQVETCILPFELGMALLKSVYNFEPDLLGRDGARVEFSIHPKERGWRPSNTVIWQVEQRPNSDLHVEPEWPNQFSRMLGDKAFGLAIAAAAGLPIPRTTVFSRRLFPFAFGQSTGSAIIWTRPCPELKTPGFYPSYRRWKDPYALLESANSAEAGASPIASILIQEGVEAVFAGKLIPSHAGTDEVHIEGVAGEGDSFMIGDVDSVPLPDRVFQAVRETYERTRRVLGAVELEWVFDGATAWIVQVNRGARSVRTGHGVRDAEASQWETFAFRKGMLEEFRQQIKRLEGTGKGVVVIGNVSPLSHIGEIADMAGVPVRFVSAS